MSRRQPRTACACGAPLPTPHATQCRPCRAAYQRVYRQLRPGPPSVERDEATRLTQNARTARATRLRRAGWRPARCQVCGEGTSADRGRVQWTYPTDPTEPRRWIAVTHPACRPQLPAGVRLDLTAHTDTWGPWMDRSAAATPLTRMPPGLD